MGSHYHSAFFLVSRDEGLTLVLTHSRRCPAPFLAVVDCGDPGQIANGFRYGTKTTYLSIMYFDCNPGYKLSGNVGRYCQSSGSWSGSQPTCVGELGCSDFQTINLPIKLLFADYNIVN